MRRVLAIWLLLGAPAAAQTEASDPDWPCVQRLVPTLGAAAYWGGPEPAEGTGWRDDPAASAVVAAAAPRDVDVERGTALSTRTLRGLERDGLVERTFFPTIPPKVNYTLTELGRSLREPIGALGQWAIEHRGTVERSRDVYDRRGEDAAETSTS